MNPVLSAWPPKKRTVWFGPIAGGIFLLSFIIVAIATQNLFLALILPPVLAIGGAYVLVGWPQIAGAGGKPLIEPRHKPYLFFVLAPLFALILYPILGTALTQAGVPLKWVAIVSIVLSLALAITAAYFLVGVPNLYAAARGQYQQLPPERRPFLFFPLTVVFFLILYLTLGVLTTRLVGELAADPTPLLNLQVLVLMPICLGIAALFAWLLVGIPKVLTRPAEHLPKVTGKHRPRLFAATLVVAGVIATLVIGALLTTYSPLPATAILALGIVLGFGVGAGIATAAWGTPARWRRYEDYRPGIHPRARIPLRVVGSLAAGLVVAISIGLADIDLFWGLLAGALVSGIVAIFLSGAHRAIAARRTEPTLVPDMPDGMKPLVLIPTWLLVSGLIFAVLTYLLPGLVPVNAIIAVVIGLGVTFLLIEQPLLKDMLAERKRERLKRKEWEARRKEKLREAEQAKRPEA